MKSLKHFTCIVLGLVIFSIPNQSLAMDLLFNHQGQLTDSNGDPVADGTYQIIYSLWDDPNTGNMLWAETLSVPAVNGLFSVVLGTVQPPEPVLFSNQLYLQTQVGTDSPMTPRSTLTSSPYAATAMSVPGFTPGPDNTVTGQYGFAAGNQNSVLSDYGAVTGGQMNIVENTNNTLPSFDTTGIFNGLTPAFGSDKSLICLTVAGWIGGGTLNTAFGGSAAVGAGSDNHADGVFTSIIGGCQNYALGGFDVVSGGYNNQTVLNGGFRVIAGGRNNIINSSWYSSVGGGVFNTIDAPTVGGTIGGGYVNRIIGHVATIGGGYFNNAFGFGATVGGGQQNISNQDYSTVGGGLSNNANAQFATIGGGGRADLADPLSSNEVYDNYGTIAGGGSNKAGSNDGIEINDQYTTIGGGYFNQTLAGYSTIGGGEINATQGIYGTVGGGRDNHASSWAATVGGGQSNEAFGYTSTIGGGLLNLITADSSVIGGGTNNLINTTSSVIAGGNINSITNNAILSAIGGGSGNLVQASTGTIAGGARNTVTTVGIGGAIGGGAGNIVGSYATVPGGLDNEASGDNSFAAGINAKATHNCSFVWSDCCIDATGAALPLYSTAANSYNARATGGFYFFTDCDTIWDPTTPPSGSYLPPGGSMWLSGSDKNLKRNIREVNNSDLLEKVASLPIYQWSYKKQDASIEHIGPMAQEFYETFQIGDNNTSIGALDPAGISLAAIKQLHKENEALKAEIESLKIQVDANKELSAKVDQLSKLVETLLVSNDQTIKKEYAATK
ncbi:MAG: hypothetical protein DWP97_02450 [Calditrichaeota bacterium]|nr:MAG: hypothetical protein DWP97_02450 [Calditrichota bacterium]